MTATTPIFALPYPVGTDRVMDGDNAIQALASRVEAVMAARAAGYLTGLTTVGNSPIVGDVSYATPAATAPVLPANRRVLVMLDLIVTTNTAGAGMRVAFQRWPIVSGVAGTAVAFGSPGDRWWQGQQVNQQNNAHFHYVDTPPAGQWAYGFRAFGFLANGGTIVANSLITVLDMGSSLGPAMLPALPGGEGGVDNELPEPPPDRVDNELPETAEPREATP